MRAEEIVDLKTAVPQEWISLSSKLVITGYQTRTAIEPFAGIRIAAKEFMILFYAGSLTYVASTPEPGIELVDGQVRVSFGQTDFAKTKSSRWIIVVRPDAKSEMNLETIEGLLRTVVAPRLLLHRTFQRIIDLHRAESGASSCSLLNPCLMGPSDLTAKSIAAIDNAAAALERLPFAERTLLIRSLSWINDSCCANDIWDSFLKIWIALEMLYIRGGNAVSSLRSIVKQAYGIAPTNEKIPFDIGRIYGIRKRIVHNGELPSYDWRFIDFLWELYRDLFAWKLSGSCPGVAISYLQSIGATLEQLIANTVP